MYGCPWAGEISQVHLGTVRGHRPASGVRLVRVPNDVGDPSDKNTVLGPLADEAQFKRVMRFIERGKQQAQLAVGGKRIGDCGYFIEPTVFINPLMDAEIYTDEVFGPVSVVKIFKTEEEVIENANDTQYGLMGGVFTQDIQRALRVSSLIKAGVVGVNCVSQLSLQAPFGGMKQSGRSPKNSKD